MKIVQAIESVAGGFGHNYFVLINDSGQVMGQIHGFQMIDGQVNTSGVGGNLLVTTSYGYNFTSNTPQQVVAQGTTSQINAIWQSAIDCGIAINANNYSYNALDTFGGHNSNAAASTLAACMGIEEVDLPGVTPGMGNIILDTETITSIQHQNGVGPDYHYNPESMPIDPSLITLIGSPVPGTCQLI